TSQKGSTARCSTSSTTSTPRERDLAAPHPLPAVGTVVADGHRVPAPGVHQPGLLVHVAPAPRGQRPHHRTQLAPLVGEGVLGPRRVVPVEAAGHPPLPPPPPCPPPHA